MALRVGYRVVGEQNGQAVESCRWLSMHGDINKTVKEGLPLTLKKRPQRRKDVKGDCTLHVGASHDRFLVCFYRPFVLTARQEPSGVKRVT